MAIHHSAQIVFLACLLSSGGVSLNSLAQNQPVNPLRVIPDTPKVAVDSSQKARSGDSIFVSVLEESSLSGNFKISADGKINYPLLGRVEVEGLTLDQLARKIEATLEEDYIRDAVISVTMADRAQDSIFLYGAVRNAGGVSFDPEEGLTLGRAVALVGGTQEFANNAKVEIQRSVNGELESITVDLDADQKKELADGDIVIVHTKPEIVAKSMLEGAAGSAKVEMGRVVVSGQVGRVGIVEIPKDGGSDILEVIALAGGTTRLARESKVKVRRKNQQGKYETLTVDVEAMRKGEGVEGFLIYPGDTIFVPETFF